ncbi:MAG: alpha/beta fold hydrolase [Gemmataceae bacterium]
MPRLRRLLLLVPLWFAVPVRGDEPLSYPPADQVRKAFLKLLDRPKVSPRPVVAPAEKTASGARLERCSFISEKKADGAFERVPVLILYPEVVKGKAPAVIVLHGTGGTAKSQLGYMEELCKRGIIGVAIDARYHGERAGGAKGAAAYHKAILAAWRTKAGEPMEHPFFYDTVWDLWRLVDFLETVPEIDAKRLGMIGFSMGGIETWMAASADERIRASVPAIGVQSFRWSLERDLWQGRARTIQPVHDAAAKDLGEEKSNAKVCRQVWDKILPGITEQFDCPSLLRLCAGRPLLILGGTKDGNCPYGGAKVAIESARRAYAEAKASDKLQVIVEDVGHTVTAKQRAASLAFFEKWLK